MDASKVLEALQAPFPPEDIEWRVGSTNKEKTKGLALAYVTNRAIQNRLDEVFGPFGWQNQFKEWKQGSQLCGISVKFGDEWITKWDGADDSNQEATKGGLSDSMKRAAYQWGIGRYLYRLPQVWMPIKQVGRSYVLDKKPTLPSWAIPKDYKQGSSETHYQEQHSKPTTSIPATIRAKWEAGGANPDMLEFWFRNCLEEGKTVEDIEQFLTEKIQEKNGTKGNGQTGNGTASDKQRKAIFAIAKNKGLNEENIKQLIRYLNHKQSTSELTSKEASDLISLLNETERDELLAMISNSRGPDFGRSIDISDDDLPF
ncbi:Rad52/Rad22 family DNA repair protein [Aneurinibacillus migulanus]|uniref:Rad52/Rad22 family DNA repair protein n=1 Tax=Aneurinibacillus migulanus TaxID=47500 RepID=UPI0009BA4D44|nr:Rad52/Rad22 family DNA repair protein [Aneurinibacillus migulanus]